MKFLTKYGAVGFICLLPMNAQSELLKFQFSEIHMGIEMSITGYAPSEATAKAACRKAFDQVEMLEQSMSDYRPTSEINQLVKLPISQPHPVSSPLYQVFQQAARVSQLSDGAFDITCGPVVALWRASRKSGQLPTESELASAKASVDWRRIKLLSNSQVQLERSDLKIDLGGIAKGFACDVVLGILKEMGVDRALVQAGGDMAASGAPPGQIGWKVTIKGFDRSFFLKNQAMSTSGDAEQFVVIGGRRYSHILDPRTGLGIQSRRQVTVIGKSGLITDPCATAISVLGTGKSAALISEFGIEVYEVLPKSILKVKPKRDWEDW